MGKNLEILAMGVRSIKKNIPKRLLSVYTPILYSGIVNKDLAVVYIPIFGTITSSIYVYKKLKNHKFGCFKD